jgi:hypothetical protein
MLLSHLFVTRLATTLECPCLVEALVEGAVELVVAASMFCPGTRDVCGRGKMGLAYMIKVSEGTIARGVRFVRPR